jgi:Domain of unknown function (DUF4158)
MHSHFLLLECVVMANQKIPSYLNAEQRQALMEIPPDLSERDLARYYSFIQEELKLINSRRRPENRFGFAVQLALLRFPERPLAEYHGDFRQVPHSILKTISHQIGLPVSTFREYGSRISTLYEHIEDICKECGYRRCGWKEYLGAARHLLLLAMESDRAIPLIETALEYFRSEKILPPTLVQIEKLVWVVLKLAERRLHALLTHRLTIGQKQQLDGLLMSEQRRGGRSQLSWLRQAPGEASPKSVTKLVERIFAIRDLELPPLPTELHQNRLLQLARKCAKYEAAPLQRMAAPRRYSLLIAYLHELSQDLTDQALDQFDRLMADLLRRGERKQDKHIRVNAKKLNAHLGILTRAMEAFLVSVEEGKDPTPDVLALVPQTVLAATVTSAKALLRPEDFDSLDLIESRFVPLRKSLLALYTALDFQPLRTSEPALQSLDHTVRLAKSRKRVTSLEQKVGRQVVATPHWTI